MLQQQADGKCGRKKAETKAENEHAEVHTTLR
eukprot:COSAG02_NODE_39768_length_413_cov_0.751592_1_plen_31_part_10